MKNKLMVAYFVMALFGSNAIFAAATKDVGKSAADKTISSLSKRTNALESQIHSLRSQIDQIQKSQEAQSDNNQPSTLMELYAHGPAVVTSPVFGLRSPTDNYELMINLSQINKDLYFLKLRQKMDNYATENNIAIPRGPVFVLSSGVEGQVVYKGNDGYSKNSKTDVNLYRAELDVVGEVASWATGVMIINYDDKDKKSSGASVARSSNSRLRIDRAWITFGELNKFPCYMSIGQLYAPFGIYKSFMVSTPVTKALGRTKGRMVILGYEDSGLYGQVYGIAAETKKDKSNEIVRHGGFNVGYAYGSGDVKLAIGGGILGNLAESEGMQGILGITQSNHSSAENISSLVHGYNGRAKLDIYDFTIVAEYIGASKAFDSTDLAFNGVGAKPQALDIEGAYNFKVKGKISTLFAGYSQTSQALGLGLPKQSYLAGYSIALIKNVLTGIEYRHDVNYNWNDTANSTNGTVGLSSVKGRHSNLVTIQVGVYF